MFTITIWHNGMPGILCVSENDDVAGDQVLEQLGPGGAPICAIGTNPMTVMASPRPAQGQKQATSSPSAAVEGEPAAAAAELGRES